MKLTNNMKHETKEHIRLDEARLDKIPWRKWGPYLRQGILSRRASSNRVCSFVSCFILLCQFHVSIFAVQKGGLSDLGQVSEG